MAPKDPLLSRAQKAKEDGKSDETFKAPTSAPKSKRKTDEATDS